MASNLRGAPLFLRPSVVRQLVGDVAAIRQAVVEVPLLPIKLVDRPRGSEDPRLAKANDDLPATEPIDWPGVFFPDSVDPDLDRPEPDTEHFESAATCFSNVDRAGDAALAPEGTSGEVACGCVVKSPANASEQPTKSMVCDRLPVKESGLDRMVAKESVSPTQRVLPVSLRNTAGERHSPIIQPSLRNLGRRKEIQKSIEIEEPAPDRERIRAMAEKLAAKRRPDAKIDYAKVAEAHRNASKQRPANTRIARPLKPAPNREECPRCGIPGWKGCDHFLPCEDQVICSELHPAGGGVARHIGPRSASA